MAGRVSIGVDLSGANKSRSEYYDSLGASLRAKLEDSRRQSEKEKNTITPADEEDLRKILQFKFQGMDGPARDLVKNSKWGKLYGASDVKLEGLKGDPEAPPGMIFVDSTGQPASWGKRTQESPTSEVIQSNQLDADGKWQPVGGVMQITPVQVAMMMKANSKAIPQPDGSVKAISMLTGKPFTLIEAPTKYDSKVVADNLVLTEQDDKGIREIGSTQHPRKESEVDKTRARTASTAEAREGRLATQARDKAVSDAVLLQFQDPMYRGIIADDSKESHRGVLDEALRISREQPDLAPGQASKLAFDKIMATQQNIGLGVSQAAAPQKKGWLESFFGVGGASEPAQATAQPGASPRPAAPIPNDPVAEARRYLAR